MEAAVYTCFRLTVVRRHLHVEASRTEFVARMDAYLKGDIEKNDEAEFWEFVPLDS